jgi:hypothetical protein
MFDNYDHLELIRAVRHDLTRNFVRTEDVLMDELEHAANESLGPSGDNSWREVNLVEVLDKIIFGVCLRIFFGPSLCRDPKYTYYVKTFTRVTGALMIFVSQLVPWPLKPLVGLIGGLPIYYYWIRLIIILYPTFKQRMQCIQTKKETAPTDMVTWMTDLALSQHPGRSISICALVVRLTLIVSIYPDFISW